MQKIRKEVSDILAEIRAGDIMAFISAFAALFFLGGLAYFITRGEYLFAIIFAVIYIPSILIVAIVTRMLLNRVSRVLSTSNKEHGNESENKQPTIILTPITQPKKPTSSLQFQKLQNAVLKVENKGNSPITKCYARVVEVKHLYGDKMWSDDYRERLKWIETNESNNICEIDIPQTDFRRIDVGYGDTLFRFSFCQEDRSQNLLGSRLYTIKIRIDGEAIDPVFFYGYVFVYQEFSYYTKTETINGKETKPESVEVYSPRMIFKEGDWKQDSEVLEHLERWNKKEETKTPNVQNVPPEFYVPDKETLKRKINIEILNFQREFKTFGFLSGGNKDKQLEISLKAIMNIWVNLLNPAKAILGNTPIPNLIDEIYTETTKFRSNWELLDFEYSEKNDWLKAVKSAHPEVVAINKRIDELGILIDKLGNSIETKTIQLIDLTKE